MTGYGRGEAENDDYKLVMEMKAVNHRFLEVSLRLPRTLISLEEQLKKQVSALTSRGKIDIFCSFEQNSVKKSLLIVDNDLAIAYHNLIVRIATDCQIESNVSAVAIAGLPGVVQLSVAEADLAAVADLAVAALAQALAGFDAMRRREGEALGQDLTGQLAELRQIMAEISLFAPQAAVEQQQKLRQRLNELIGDLSIDEARLQTEIAFLADKADINEELTRLASHIDQFTVAMSLDEPSGRKLEFITQEINRELNTIGSKSNNLAISNQVIAGKSVLEKIREQVQNIE